MAEDDADDSLLLVNLYETADIKGKELIDDVFICLCGWSMKNLLVKIK